MAIERHIGNISVVEVLQEGVTVAETLVNTYRGFKPERTGVWPFRRTIGGKPLPPTPDLRFDEIYFLILSNDGKHSMAKAKWGSEQFVTVDNKVVLQGQFSNATIERYSEDFSNLLVITTNTDQQKSLHHIQLQKPAEGEPEFKVNTLVTECSDITLAGELNFERFLLRTESSDGKEIYYVNNGEAKAVFPPASYNSLHYFGEHQTDKSVQKWFIEAGYDDHTELGVFDSEGNLLRGFQVQESFVDGSFELRKFRIDGTKIFWSAKSISDQSYSVYEDDQLITSGLARIYGIDFSDTSRILTVGRKKDGGVTIGLDSEALLEEENLEYKNMTYRFSSGYAAVGLRNKEGKSCLFCLTPGGTGLTDFYDSLESFQITDLVKEGGVQEHFIEAKVIKGGQPVRLKIVGNANGSGTEVTEEPIAA